MAAKSGIRTVAYNQICLTFLQKLCTADGGTVCDFDTDIRVGLMEFLKIEVNCGAPGLVGVVVGGIT